MALCRLAEDGVRGEARKRSQASDDQAASGARIGSYDMTKNRSALENVCGDWPCDRA
jgi:hypothetical protein